MIRARMTIGGGFALLLLAAAASAQKLEVKSASDPNADFTAVRTYAWLPPAPMVSNVAPGAFRNPDLTDEVLGPHIVAAVDRQLAARGLVKAEKDQADVHVAYMAALTTGMSSTYLGEHYGYVTGMTVPVAPGYTPSTSTTIHEKGTIVIEVVQRSAKRAIWTGAVQSRVEQVRKLEDRVKRIDDAMKRVFERFPIRPRG